MLANWAMLGGPTQHAPASLLDSLLHVNRLHVFMPPRLDSILGNLRLLVDVETAAKPQIGVHALHSMKIMIGPGTELLVVGILEQRRHDAVVPMDDMRMPPHSTGGANRFDNHRSRDVECLDENMLACLKASGVVDQQFSKLGFAWIVHG